MRFYAMLFSLSALLGASCAAAAAPPAPTPFAVFFAQLQTQTAADAAGQLGPVPLDPVRLEEARRYLVRYYSSLTIKRSNALDRQVFDCMRYDQQPGLRVSASRFRTLPAVQAAPQAAEPDGVRDVSEATQVQLCDRATFPVQRMTLVDIMRAGSLRDYLSKDGAGGGAVAP